MTAEKREPTLSEAAMQDQRVQALISEAVVAGASDIHIEHRPEAGDEMTTHVKFRVMGVLKAHRSYSHEEGQSLIGLFRMAGHLSPTRRPEQARVEIEVSGHGSGYGLAESAHHPVLTLRQVQGRWLFVHLELFVRLWAKALPVALPALFRVRAHREILCDDALCRPFDVLHC